MTHRSKKPLRSGVREYFNQKRPVNTRRAGKLPVVGHISEKKFVDLLWAPNREKDVFGYHTERQCHQQATPRSTASMPSAIWSGEPLMLLRARGCASSTTLHVNFNFSSTYSESSIMRSANCSAGSPAKFLSTNSFT